MGRRTAKLEDEQLLWEQRTTLRVDEQEIPYLRAPIDLVNSPDRDFRIALDEARVSKGAAGLNGIRRDAAIPPRLRIVELGDYVNTARHFGTIWTGRTFGQASSADDLYRDVLKQLVRRRLGLDLAVWSGPMRAGLSCGQFDGAFVGRAGCRFGHAASARDRPRIRTERLICSIPRRSQAAAGVLRAGPRAGGGSTVRGPGEVTPTPHFLARAAALYFASAIGLPFEARWLRTIGHRRLRRCSTTALDREARRYTSLAREAKARSGGGSGSAAVRALRQLYSW